MEEWKDVVGYEGKYNSNYGTKNQRVNETKRKNKLKREQSR